MHTITIKTPADFYIEIDGLILKLLWKCKEHRIVNTILKKNVEDSY